MVTVEEDEIDVPEGAPFVVDFIETADEDDGYGLDGPFDDGFDVIVVRGTYDEADDELDPYDELGDGD